MQISTFVLAATFLALLAPAAEAAEAAGSAAKAQSSGTLKPGRSAGVRRAQQVRTGLALIGGSAIIAVVVVAASSGGSGSSGSQPNMQSTPATTP
jgi:hypothetical protein